MNPSFAINPKKRGAALLIVLAFVVLLCGIVVAYLARTSTDRQLAHGTFSENRADILARSALDLVVGDLRQEIVNGSTESNVNNHTIYIPTPATNMVPVRSGTPSPTPTPSSNMVRRSMRSDPIAAPAVGSRASAVNSTDASLNGRSVTTARWNKHYLIPRDPALYGGLNANKIGTDPVPSFTAPDWVLVTNTGPQVLTSPNTSVVGRYSYAIYDEGGLLDINVAGFPYATPSPSPTPPVPPQPVYAPSPPYVQGSYPAGYTAATYTARKIGRKGTAAFADLSVIAAGSTTYFPADQVNNIIGWRNYASVQPGSGFSSFTFDSAAATRYYGVALSNLATFLQVGSTVWNNGTDQAFASRQELLAFRSANGFSQNLLQYLGTFSREYNRPSWKPPTVTTTNPDLSSIRATSNFSRIDTSQATQGEPLFKNRFPLRRLSWLTYKGPSALRNFPPASPALAVTDADYDMWQLLWAYNIPATYLQQGTVANIKNAFGLVWDSRAYVPYVAGSTKRAGQQWVYNSPNSGNSGGNFDPVSNPNGNPATVIKTLSTIQSEAREPDFLEILKTVILNGSVGLGTNNTVDTFVKADPKYYDTTNGKSADFQLMQIAANIMDAWDTDNIPTFLSFGSDPTTLPVNQPYVLAGIENLPYLNKLVFTPYFPPSASDYFKAWLIPSLWNPHQNAPGAGTIRVALNGPNSFTAYGQKKIGNVPTEAHAGPLGSGSMDIDASQFTSTPAPQVATPMSYTGCVTQATDFAGPDHWGFRFPFTSSTPNGNQILKQDADSAWIDFGTFNAANTMELQVQIPSTTTFIPYQTWKIAAINVPIKCQSAKNNFNGTSNKLQDPEFVALDPRTTRFGIWTTDAFNQTGGTAKKDYTQGLSDSLDETNPANRIENITGFPPQGSNFTVGSLPANLSLYATNGSSGSNPRYIDLDGVQRHGDWTTDSSGTAKGTTIMYAGGGGNYFDRPQIFSSPFQSVAELGQVFRDQPWKTLAFTIANSGDAGLLDAFTMQDVSDTGLAPSAQYVWVTAGRTSLNTRQAPVLTAMISQVTKKIAGTGVIPTGSSDTTVSDIATALVGVTTGSPLVSKGELVTKFSGDSHVAGLLNKEARESIMRALSDAGQTRTWNLMIDVIAQSGRYPPTVTANPQPGDLPKFVVEGEKRYWLHIAIDRFTGEVIDQQLEAVYE